MDVSNVTETTQDLSALVVEPGNQIPSDAGCFNTVDHPPVVDASFSRLAKNTALPLAHAMAFKDQVDKRLDSFMKRNFVDSGATLQPAFAISWRISICMWSRCPTINRTATSTKSSPPAGLQTSFTSDLYNRNQTDLEASKGCEARWLQLFHLVERQCQDQIVAQQEQFTHQIQLIRDEIKHLIQLQGSWSQWNSCTEDRVLNMASSLHPIRSGQNPGDTEKRESISSSFSQSNELDLQKKAFITQEHFLENTSVSSGYGTHSASEPNTCLSSCSQTTSRESRLPAVETLKECKTEPQRIHHVMQCSDKQCKLPIHEKSSEDIIFPSEHTEYVNTSSKSNSERSSKSLTTWALKCKRGHRKKLPQIDKASVNSSEENSQSDREAMDQSGKTDGSSQAFYLNQRAESANSIISAGSGFTYWMMDEKEMYHPLPESFGGTKLGKSGFTEPEEPRIPSLTDVYQQKQREGVRYPDWKPLSPAEYTHPPEVLTLDPTLHRKPYHDPGFSPHSYTDNCRVALTPDSILENTSYSHYKEEIGSSATSASSLLGESPNSYPNSPMVASEELKINRYQNRENMDYQRCPGDATFDRKAYCTDDEFNSLTSSVAQSPVPVTEENMHEFSSVLSLDHPLMLSNIRQSLREKHARHIADLRDYYESEISSLKQQLLINNKSSAAEDLKKIKSLSERYDHMEGALTEASTRIRLLENKNQELEMQVAEWKERHQTADNTSKALQEQIEEIRARGKEKENSISRLQSRLKEVEEAFEKAFKLSDDKDGRLKQEHKIFQDLLSEYESLGNEHERVKDTLSITENKLRDAHIEINQLKRSVSKLEAQIKQLEHENMVKLRHIAEGQLWQSCAKANRVDNLHVMDVAKRKCLTPTAACSIFTGQPLDNKQSENENTQTAQYEPKSIPSPLLSLFDTVDFPPGRSWAAFSAWRRRSGMIVADLLQDGELASFEVLQRDWDLHSSEYWWYHPIHSFVMSHPQHPDLQRLTPFELLCYPPDPGGQPLRRTTALIYYMLLDPDPVFDSFCKHWKEDLGYELPPEDWVAAVRSSLCSSRNVTAMETSYKLSLLCYGSPQLLHSFYPSVPSCWRCGFRQIIYNSPPEKEASYDSLKQRAKRKDSASQESPILKALRDFEEEKELKRWSTRAEKGNRAKECQDGAVMCNPDCFLLTSLIMVLRSSNSINCQTASSSTSSAPLDLGSSVLPRGQTSRKQIVEFSDCWRPHESVETNRECQRQLNSPSGPRSSSLPPRNRKPDTVTTPTKRELMLAPVSVKYSPKRSPRENFSPGLTQLLSSDDSPMTRFDVVWDDSSSHKESSPRKRLQFTSLEDKDVMEKIVINPQTSTESSSKPQRPVLLPPYETEFTYKDRMRNIADTERLFDDLIQEKRQIEAALSRMPGSAGRLNLQLRVKKENLEDRLEKINRELGSVRMTLKKFHILPTSANI
ncbi:M-phase phosphoprotein 9 [Rhinophrynus dorsalis]